MSETSGAKITYRFNKPGDTVFGPFKIRMPHVQTKSRRKKNNEHYRSTSFIPLFGVHRLIKGSSKMSIFII